MGEVEKIDCFPEYLRICFYLKTGQKFCVSMASWYEWKFNISLFFPWNVLKYPVKMSKRRFGHAISIFLFFGFPAAASASCCAGASRLEWENSTEVLEYHSCGCADSCWVAEIKSKKTGRLKARLRCDCEKTYFSIGTGKIGGRSERIYENNCARFENDDKFKAINETLSQVLDHSSSGMR